MSAYEVKDKLVTAIKEDKYDFIVVNFANGDMVGHTGIYAAIEKAVKAVDECVKEVVETAKAMNDYEVIIIADHGNARQCRESGWYAQYGAFIESCSVYLCDGQQGG